MPSIHICHLLPFAAGGLSYLASVDFFGNYSGGRPKSGGGKATCHGFGQVIVEFEALLARGVQMRPDATEPIPPSLRQEDSADLIEPAPTGEPKWSNWIGFAARRS